MLKKRKVATILYLKIVQNNDTTKLGLFSTVESNILTNKYVIQMIKRINELRNLNFHEVWSKILLGQNFRTVTKNVLFLRQKTKKIMIRIKALKFRLKSFMGMLQKVLSGKTLHIKNESNKHQSHVAWYKKYLYHTFYDEISNKLV